MIIAKITNCDNSENRRGFFRILRLPRTKKANRPAKIIRVRPGIAENTLCISILYIVYIYNLTLTLT